MIGLALHDRLKGFRGQTALFQMNQALGPDDRSFRGQRPFIADLRDLLQSFAKGLAGSGFPPGPLGRRDSLDFFGDTASHLKLRLTAEEVGMMDMTTVLQLVREARDGIQLALFEGDSPLAQQVIGSCGRIAIAPGAYQKNHDQDDEERSAHEPTRPEIVKCERKGILWGSRPLMSKAKRKKEAIPHSK
jgi:hypothetical protein